MISPSQFFKERENMDALNYTCVIEDELDKDVFIIILASCSYKKLTAKVHQSCRGMHDKIMEYRIIGPDKTIIEYRFDKAFAAYQKM